MDDGIPQNRDPAMRRPDGKFGPGNSANPGGQPQYMKRFREALKGLHPDTEQLARKVIQRALDVKDLEEIVANSGDDPQRRVNAEKAIATRLDQGMRMTAEVWRYTLTPPKARVKVEGVGPSPLAGLTPEQLVALATGKGE